MEWAGPVITISRKLSKNCRILVTFGCQVIEISPCYFRGTKVFETPPTLPTDIPPGIEAKVKEIESVS